MSLSFVGNKDTIENIRLAAKRERLAHAILIEGEEGLGKKTLARFISSALLCEGEDKPCGKCRACTLVEKDSHTDVSFFSPDGVYYKVAQIRDIREKAYVMPIEAKRKIFILEKADLMNKQSQNALLKIIEEPPSFLTFILLCENSEALLPTVLSRCVKFRLSAPNFIEARDFLVSLGKDKEQSGDALISTGCNIGKALSVLENTMPAPILAAKELFSLFEEEKRLDALLLFHKFEKNREDIILLLSTLRSEIVSKMKENFLSENSFRKTVRYNEAVEKIIECIKKLKQNGNVTLLTTTLCAEIFAVFDK